MTKKFALLLTLALATPLFADSIDDAEAKRRGVPVAQVQAENALEREKAKTAALEKQLAALKKQLAEQSGQPLPDAPDTAAATPGTPPGAPATPAISLNFSGPRESSPLYDDFVARYLDGNWTTLAADLAAKQKEIAALPAGNLADLTYIKQTLAESRPAWWDQVKAGKLKQVKATVWKQALTFNFQDAPAARFSGLTGNIYNLAWPTADMDSSAALPLENLSLNFPGDHGYKKSDGIQQTAWGMMGGIAVMSQVGPEKGKLLSPDSNAQLTRFGGFWQQVTAAYYATPPGRRLVLVAALASFSPEMDNRSDWTTRRPLGAALMIDIAAHPGRYKPLHIETILGMEKLGGSGMSAEVFLTTPVCLQLLDAKLTLEEDRLLRDMIKSLADANPSWSNPKITLPNNLRMDLNPANDAPNAAQRSAFIAAPKK